jgi:hypothetical protein
LPTLIVAQILFCLQDRRIFFSVFPSRWRRVVRGHSADLVYCDPILNWEYCPLSTSVNDLILKIKIRLLYIRSCFFLLAQSV